MDVEVIKKLKQLEGSFLGVSGEGRWGCRKMDVKVLHVNIHTSEWWDEDDAPPPAGWKPETTVDVILDPKTWTHEGHGMIYTDPGFLTAARKITGLELHYTEQGMQGTEGVHLIVGKHW